MSSSCSCFLQNSRVYSTVLIIVLLTANEAFMTAVVPVAPEVLLHLCYTRVYRTVCQNVAQTGLFTLSDCHTYQQIHYSNKPQDFTFTNVSRSNADPILDLLQDCHERLSFQNGLLLATKFLMRILLTAPASWLIDKVGIFWPFFFGTLLALISCLMIGFADSMTVLFLSRAFHGIAGTGIEISGIVYLAVRYQDDENLKGFVLGMVISSFAFGTLIGPTLGSVMYGLISQSAPFLALSVIILASLVFTPMVMPVNVTVPVTESSPSAITLLMNPCTLLVSVLAMTTTLGIAFTNATLPIWLKSSFKTPEWEIGLIFVPTSAAHIVSGPLIGYWSKTLKRWRCMLIGSLAMAIGIATLPLCNMIWQLIPSMTLIGFGFGTVDSTLIGIMYRIVDVWHEGAQSSAAAVFVFEFCLAYTIGLLTSGAIVGFIGFKWTMWSLAIAIVVSSPFCLLLSRIQEERETKQPLLPKPEVLLPPCLPTTIEDKPQPLPDESSHLL